MSRRPKKWRPGYASPGWPAFVAADHAWTAELHRVFGRNSGDARYDARGLSTPRLKALHRRRHQAARRAKILPKVTVKRRES
jgi:hypothetical protein